MQSVLSFLLFAVFFYLMMRFGCGAHMIHGGHGGHGSGGHEGRERRQPEMLSAEDPVCGMAVQPGEGYSEIYGGRQYRFCSRKCLDKFDSEPRLYAA